MAQVPIDPIEKTYKALKRRSFLVFLGRIGLPFIVIVVILGLISDNFAQRKLEEIFGDPINFNPKGIVIQAPTFRGTMGNGISYMLQSGDVVYGTVPRPVATLKNIDAHLVTPKNREIRILTKEAVFLTNQNKIQFNERVDLLGADGSKGYFLDGDFKLDKQLFTSNGPLYFELACGSSLNANNGIYDSQAARWTFERAKLTIIQEATDVCKAPGTFLD